MTNSNCDSVCKTGGQEVKTDGTKASQAAVANQQTTTNIACTQCTSGCGQNANSAEVKQDPAASAGNNVAAAPVVNDPSAQVVAPAPADPGNSQITGSEIQSGGKKIYRSRKRQKTKKNKRKSKKSKRSKKSRKNKRKTKRKNRKLH